TRFMRIRVRPNVIASSPSLRRQISLSARHYWRQCPLAYCGHPNESAVFNFFGGERITIGTPYPHSGHALPDLAVGPQVGGATTSHFGRTKPRRIRGFFLSGM